MEFGDEEATQGAALNGFRFGVASLLRDRLGAKPLLNGCSGGDSCVPLHTLGGCGAGPPQSSALTKLRHSPHY
jgi:hypothetical protein